MTALEARQILALYRPGTADARDLEVVEALALAQRDPALRQWLDQHCAVQQALRRKFRELPVSAVVKQTILARRKIVQPPAWWRRPAWRAAAAGVMLLAGATALWLRPRPPDRFADFRARMVRTALREYRMDIVTNDMTQVRRFLAERQAPSDYELTPALEQLSLTGGGLLRWQNHPVSMVCFDRGDQQMLFLFVLHRGAVKDPPPARPRETQVNKLKTASWTQGDKTYVLAGPEDTDFAGKVP
jgi:hypothetical protein